MSVQLVSQTFVLNLLPMICLRFSAYSFGWTINLLCTLGYSARQDEPPTSSDHHQPLPSQHLPHLDPIS